MTLFIDPTSYMTQSRMRSVADHIMNVHNLDRNDVREIALHEDGIGVAVIYDRGPDGRVLIADGKAVTFEVRFTHDYYKA